MLWGSGGDSRGGGAAALKVQSFYALLNTPLSILLQSANCSLILSRRTPIYSWPTLVPLSLPLSLQQNRGPTRIHRSILPCGSLDGFQVPALRSGGRLKRCTRGQRKPDAVGNRERGSARGGQGEREVGDALRGWGKRFRCPEIETDRGDVCQLCGDRLINMK